MAKTRTEKTVVNASFAIFGRFIYIFTNFLLRTVFINYLGIQYVGVSGLFTDVLTLLSLTELGVSSAISHSLYKPIAEKDDIKIAKLMNFYKVAYRNIAIVILIIGLAIVPFIDLIVTEVPDIKENIKLIFLFYIIKTVISYLLIYKSTLLIAKQKQYMVSKVELVINLLKVLVEAILIIVFKQFFIYLVIEVIATLIQNIYISYKVDKEHPLGVELKKEKLDKKEFKILLKNIKGLSMYKISSSVGQGIDSVIISAFVSTTAIGLLSNYTLIKNQIFNLIKQCYNALVPSIGNLAVETNNDKQYDIFKKLDFLNFWLICFCAVSFSTLVTPFVSLWLGNEYIMSLLLVNVLAFDFFLSGMLQPIASFRTGNGIFIEGQYRPLITALLNVIFSLVLVNVIGLEGVIIATIISKLTTQWYDPWLLYQKIFNKSFKKYVSQFSSYIFTYFFISYVTHSLSTITYHENGIINFIILISICIVVPNVILVILYFKTEEFKFSKKLFIEMKRSLLMKLKRSA